jgi:hypothetical protein
VVKEIRNRRGGDPMMSYLPARGRRARSAEEEEMSTCCVCGVGLEGRAVLYTADGEIVCEKCSTQGEVRAGLARSAAAAKSAALGNVVIGAASFFFNPFYAFSLVTFGNAAYLLRQLRKEKQSGAMAGDGLVREVGAVIGAALGAASIVLRLVV